MKVSGSAPPFAISVNFLSLIHISGDEWEHERPAEPEKKPSIRERLEQGKKECAEKCKAQPYKEKSAPEL